MALKAKLNIVPRVLQHPHSHRQGEGAWRSDTAEVCTKKQRSMRVLARVLGDFL